MIVELTPLPGIGICRMFTTADGRRVGVVTHRPGGRRDLVYESPDDPDATCSLTLTRDEAVTLARLLGILDVLDIVTVAESSPG
ncbi:potassium transporter TrkA [Micromonospora sp. NPDC049114]|uniref:potassium transporter TrkA n=1 Tax=unclassified Micromonospora TaxID=2617518 RepID=UPI001F459164|nr:potassium transporter TrkA [Micromonospora sp. MH99]MCF0095373.1 Ammonium/H(+) antiporter subunit AmhM [Micromonospora sp. MH99]